MDSLRPKRREQPEYVDRLLHGLVKSTVGLPADARLLRSRRELPDDLQSVLIDAARQGLSWSCWLDGAGHIWLFTGEISLPLSRQQGEPVLQVKHYREDGKLKGTTNWVNHELRWRAWSADSPTAELENQRRFMLTWRAFWAREGRPETARMATVVLESLERLEKFEGQAAWPD